MKSFSMFHRAFFNSIIDEYQHMHFFTFNTVLVYEGWNFNSGNYLFTSDTK